MDYWKDVPGIDDSKSIVLRTEAAGAGDAKNYLKRDVIKKMISSGKWEVSSGDVEGKTGSSLTLKQMGKKGRGISREVIIEAEAEDRKNADLQNLIGDLNSAIGALNDLKTQILRKNPASAKRARKTLGTSLKFIDNGIKSVFGKG